MPVSWMSVEAAMSPEQFSASRHAFHRRLPSQERSHTSGEACCCTVHSWLHQVLPHPESGPAKWMYTQSR